MKYETRLIWVLGIKFGFVIKCLDRLQETASCR
jgi:hypothetical protein